MKYTFIPSCFLSSIYLVSVRKKVDITIRTKAAGICAVNLKYIYVGSLILTGNLISKMLSKHNLQGANQRSVLVLLVGWLVGFYGISPRKGYLLPIPLYANINIYKSIL